LITYKIDQLIISDYVGFAIIHTLIDNCKKIFDQPNIEILKNIWYTEELKDNNNDYFML